MLNYKTASKNEKQFLSLTGMTVSVFNVLHKSYRKEWGGYIKVYTVSGEKRMRPHRKRPDGVLEETEDQLMFILHYIKSNGIQEHHAAVYGMHQSQCNAWIHLLLRLLKQTLTKLGEMPERDAKKIKSVLSGVQGIYIDGTERDIQRPLDEEKQRKYYSGKKNS
ncbi:MAG: transposase family protein [Chitinophagaceae bacterium]